MMGKVIMSGIVPQLVAPSIGIKASDLAVGSTVKLNENGTPVEFYVAKHNYESGLNGAGRTLLVRKEYHSKRVWHSGSYAQYAVSDIDTWLNGTYKTILDANVQDLIGQTAFYYTPSGSNGETVQTMERSVFILSATEYGKTGDNVKTEGSALSIASVLLNTYYGDSTIEFWTRSPYCNPWGADTGNCFLVDYQEGVSYGSIKGSQCVRPSFTLPSNALFDETTLILKGVA